MKQVKFQIGKNGLTAGVIESLNNAFRTKRMIRVSLLQSAGRDREEKRKIAEELAEKLEGRFKFTIVGFTIIMKKIGKT